MVGVTTPIDAYFVCATPRTGSSLLLGLLESTRVAGRPQAYFREPDESLWAGRWGLPGTAGYDDFVRAALAAGRTGNGVFGAKLMWGTLDHVVARLGVVHPDLAGRDLPLLERAFGRTRFVYLRRDDVLAQAVSWLRAEQTGAWYVGVDGETDDAERSGREPGYDADGIRALIEQIGEHNAAWEEWFASQGVRPYTVRYEDLDADLAGVTRGILGFLGLDLPEGHTVEPRHHRQADDLNAAWIERYRRESA
ncbi:Stf0 family sulfotransferase [Nonomuraea helvata]|uniref:Trehalose 2-sulfotransferase n=1 Tax=Nonomuraea helvata TaxID=37484 RepID=A0ABV5S292_9ACTN